MTRSLSTLLISIFLTSALFADESIDWIRDGTGTGATSTIDKNDNVFVASWDGSIYARKFDKFGNLQWENHYTTPIIFNYVYPTQVHADSLGNVTLVGYRYTSPTEGRAANALLAIKYDASGTMLWENIIEGDFSPWNNSLFRTNVSSVADPADNVFIASAGNVSGYPTTGFNVIKVNPEGVIEWVSTKNISGFPYHFVSRIRLNGSRLAVAGHTNYWLANAVIWVLDVNGNSKWTKTEAGIGGTDAMIDNTGKVYLLTSSTPGYASDLSIFKYKSNGTFMWHQLFDFGGAEIPSRMELAPDNKMVVLAYGTQTGISGYVDWLTLKVTLNGVLSWSKRYDEHTGNDEIPGHMAIDTDGDIFVTGIGGPFPGGFNLGARQFVTVKYKSNGTLVWTYAQDTINEYQSGRRINIDSRGNPFVLVDINSLTYHFLDNTGADPCSVPTGITVSGITETESIISWLPVTNAYLYHVQYKTTTSPIWSSLTTDQTNISLSGLISGTTYEYHVEAVCNSGPTGYSTTSTFTTLGTTYCTSAGVNATGDWIDLVYVSDLLNSTIESTGGYSDFTYLSVSMVQGTTYSFTLSAAMTGLPHFEYWNVWIDFNGDADFTDAGENIVSYNSDQIGWESHSFTVPISAVLGNTMMRVSMKRGSNASSCETFAKGEVEDYTVTILPGKQSQLNNSTTSKIEVYPNPAKDLINVNLTEFEGVNTLTCYDINGQLMKNMIVSSEVIQLNISEFPSGIYYMISTNEKGETKNAKFIKQ